VNPSRPWHVNAYLAFVISLGISVLIGAVTHWQCEDGERFAAYLSLGCLAGSLKVRLPGMTGTFSLTFLFVLIAVVDLTFAETVIIAISSMIVQCVWRPATRPAPIQVIFSAASVSVGASAAYLTARAGGWTNFAIQLSLSAMVYFVVNTLLISGILAQVERREFLEVWGAWFRLSLTYYAAGVVVAAIMIVSNHHFGWMFSLLALPLMYLEYLCYRLKIDGQNGSASPTS
jgi:hypothetical protein